MKSMNDMLKEYQSKARNSSSEAHFYEKGKIFRLYVNSEQAKALHLDAKLINNQGFISLNKLSELERKQMRRLLDASLKRGYVAVPESAIEKADVKAKAKASK